MAAVQVQQEVVEHAVRYSGGSMLVWPNDPEFVKRFPAQVLIEAEQGVGGKVYRRRVIVLSDWEEVPGDGSSAATGAGPSSE